MSAKKLTAEEKAAIQAKQKKDNATVRNVFIIAVVLLVVTGAICINFLGRYFGWM